jgi:hypothetical protein
VIVGSAAGALIGLQFVVMTLIAERPPLRAAEAGAAFATPTIVHFGAALLLSALLRAPWPTVWRTEVPQIAADFAVPPEVGGPGAEIVQPLPEARKDGLSLETEPLTGPVEAPSITDRAGCARRHFEISSDPGERASAS